MLVGSLKLFLLYMNIETIHGKIFRGVQFSEEGHDQKASNSSWTTTTISGSTLTFCSAMRSDIDTCGGFNIQTSDEKMCEILPSESVMVNSAAASKAKGWNFFKKKLSMEAFYLKSKNCICMPYDDWNDGVQNDKFACSSAPYLLDLWNSGKTDCRFILQRNMDYDLYAIQPTFVGPIATNFHVPFANCYIGESCLSVVCFETECFKKSENHLTLKQSGYQKNLSSDYWYATCQKPASTVSSVPSASSGKSSGKTGK